MRFVAISLVIVLVLAGLGTAQDPVLSVAGSGLPGTPLIFTVTGSAEVNQVAFLGISPLPGATSFGWVTMDLAWPILACGMGSLNQGFARHPVMVPKDWPPMLTIAMYAQALVVKPAGAGYQYVKTSVVMFWVRGE
ncbi:MAG: hypothetical protein JXQ29_07695 [Planctomycetes bacterium]|nr:hypothetical protein [Planctomycetota bacterium]